MQEKLLRLENWVICESYPHSTVMERYFMAGYVLLMMPDLHDYFTRDTRTHMYWGIISYCALCLPVQKLRSNQKRREG